MSSANNQATAVNVNPGIEKKKLTKKQAKKKRAMTARKGLRYSLPDFSAENLEKAEVLPHYE